MIFLILFSILILFFLSGLFWYRYFYNRENKLLNRLLQMVENAANGYLDRTEISESKVSSLENSLKKYLDDSLLSKEKEQKQKAIIQELISDIAHQTLTPIANLKLYTDLLSESAAHPSEETDAIDTVREQTEKLDFLIQSLVKLSRMESGIITVTPVKNQISLLLFSVYREYAAKAEEKKIHFHLSQHLSAFFAVFDLKWTTEALGNLVDNAIKYTNPGGDIDISVEEYTFFMRIDIKDTGIGIAKTEINDIFSRFYRSLSVSEKPGVGIGLYLAREIIELQKGYIKASSEKGKGSVFSVYLPKEEV